MAKRNLKVPNDLHVEGQSLTPRTSPRPSPSTSQDNSSDEDDDESEEMTVLGGLREINDMLKNRMEQIRRTIGFNETKFEDEKAKIVEHMESEIQVKDSIIDGLKESLSEKEERIQRTKRAAAEKDRVIRQKCLEIDDLRKMTDEIKNKARKIQRQVRRAQIQSKQDHHETHSQLMQKAEERRLLEEELASLRSQLAAFEEALAKAIMVIGEQNEKMKILNADKFGLQDNFKKELNLLTKSMRREMDRINEVILQNIEEMRVFREENKKIHEKIHSVMTMLKEKHFDGGNTLPVTMLKEKYLDGGNTLTMIQPRTHTETEHTESINQGAVSSQGVNRRTNDIRQSGTADNVFSKRPRETCLPPIKTPLSSQGELRESGQFFTKSKSNINLPLHSRSSPSLNYNAAQKSTTGLPSNRFVYEAQSIPNGKTPIKNHITLSTQTIIPPHVQTKARTKPLVTSIDDGIADLKRQPPGRGGKPCVKKGTTVRK